jgi:hypothetical protein
VIDCEFVIENHGTSSNDTLTLAKATAIDPLARPATEITRMQKLLAIAFVLPALSLGTPASAYTQEEQIACQGDAFQFCGDAIPDEQRVKACLIANLRRVSPACRRVFNRSRVRHR